MRILLTSARSFIALDLARKLHCAGYEVFVAETMRWHLCRFSNAVNKAFVVRSPRLSPEFFIEDIIKIVNDEKIDYIIPVYEEIVYLAKARESLPKHCQLFSPNFDLLNELHNKWLFTLKLKDNGFETPKTFLIQTNEDLNKLDPSSSYALKACYSRASLNVKKVNGKEPCPELNIAPNNPWIAQEWIEGNQFCTYSICQNGKIKAHTTYPVGYTADGKGCITFEAIEHTSIFRWIETFVEKIQFTGQIAFDFIQTTSELYAIECNPRATNGILLFDDHDCIDRAFFNENSGLTLPELGAKRQLRIAMLMYGWKKSAHSNNNIKLFCKEFFKVKDVVYNKHDKAPFFAQPLIWAEIWSNSRKSDLSLPACFMFDYEWNGEIEFSSR